MTRPAYDPLRAPAPRFPRHRFEAAGLDEAAVNTLAEQYDGMSYEERVRFTRDATRAPNEELSRRYAGGEDAGPSPAMLTPEDLAHQHKAEELKAAAANAGLPTSGTKVEVAGRLLAAGATGDLPIITPEQVAADAAQQQPAEPAAPEPTPEAPQDPPAPAEQTPAPPPPPPEQSAQPADAPSTSPEPAPAPTPPGAAPDATAGTTAPAEGTPADAAPATAPDADAAPAPAPETPAAPAAGTTTDGGQPA